MTIAPRLMAFSLLARTGAPWRDELPEQYGAWQTVAGRFYRWRHSGICFTIPRKDNEKHRGKFDKSIYRTRNVVERCFNRLKQFRRIATRYEKKAENYLAMLTLASIQLWL